MEFTFDDDLFGSEKNRQTGNSNSVENYVPKFEYSCWFFDDTTPSTDQRPADFLDKERMRAAYYYLKRDYDSAVRSYGLLLKSTTSTLLQLEFMESYARSLLACDRFDDADGIATDFYKKAINYDQQLQALNLLSDLYWRWSQFQRCAAITGCLLSMLDGGNADMWYRLGQCFIQWNANGTGPSDPNELMDLRQLNELNLDGHHRMCYRKCLFKVRALFLATFATSVGHARLRNEAMRQQIENEISNVALENADTIVDQCKPEAQDSVENENSGEDDSRSCGKSEQDKMLDVDLVNVFSDFLRKWLL